MYYRAPTRKRPMENPSTNPRPQKRHELARVSSCSTPRVSDDPMVADINLVVSEFLKKIDYFELPYDKQLKYFNDILSTIVGESGGKLDPRFIPRKTFGPLTEQHPDLIDEISECCNMDPPSFGRILELGSSHL